MTTPATTTTDGRDVRAKTLRGLLLARELDTARHKRGFTTRNLAEQMSMSPAMLNRVMTGRRVPTALEIGGLCSLLDIHPTRRPHLYRLTADADLTDWLLRPGTEGDTVSSIEQIAETITWVDPTTIPRPLRTTAYHDAITRNAGEEPFPAPPQNTRAGKSFIHTQALTHPGIPGETMREQLRHLRDTTPGNIRLLPAASPPHPGFRLLEIDHFPPVVHINHHGTHILLEHPESTTPYTALCRTLETIALTTGHTRRVLNDLATHGRHR
ncbi:helix-turn-helix domain-containing protein [Actinokineospora sp. PR83]|uniref:helix-turn-helix domain-containing protein n=1 Tax=Actinokineospora sp. PR83 TaxID=2884908 RepID=UPI0027E1196F|nr:Scr1 family TA system antitoxin-like transcriptional regulator [Actinokineospora sp. PR83]MCG8917848.1 helix-turn-helix domain-containing protein [Actinokineospora sp. PR83]